MQPMAVAMPRGATWKTAAPRASAGSRPATAPDAQIQHITRPLYSSGPASADYQISSGWAAILLFPLGLFCRPLAASELNDAAAAAAAAAAVPDAYAAAIWALLNHPDIRTVIQSS